MQTCIQLSQKQQRRLPPQSPPPSSSPHATMPTPSFFRTHPRACAVILASSQGSRLFPMTGSGALDSNSVPKHLMPVAGVPSLLRLLGSLTVFSQIVVAVAVDDENTLVALQNVAVLRTEENTMTTTTPQTTAPRTSLTGTKTTWLLESKAVAGQKIHVVQLTEDCFGSIDALRQVEETALIHPLTQIVVLPGDLVFLTTAKETTKVLDPLVRPAQDAACTVLLVDVLELDEHGLPLKESAKAKKGGLARDKEDIEYIGLSYPSPSWYEESTGKGTDPSQAPRIVIKKLKIDVESDEDMTGSTSKLDVPKSLLRRGQLVIRTEWSDVHVYSFAPWVRRLIAARSKNFSSIQEDLLPLLVSRQFRGQKATFGKDALARLEEGQNENDDMSDRSSISPHHVDAPGDEPYSVLAVPLSSKTALRANTISGYLFANKEIVAKGSSLPMPEAAKWNGKFQTLVLPTEQPDGTTAATVIPMKGATMKSSIVGKNCILGEKCRLNNVVILDGVTIGEQCSLQNTLVGFGAKLGNNCSLNDCQVGPGTEVPSQTKEKGEAFTASDVLDDGGIL